MLGIIPEAMKKPLLLGPFCYRVRSKKAHRSFRHCKPLPEIGISSLIAITMIISYLGNNKIIHTVIAVPVVTTDALAGILEEAL